MSIGTIFGTTYDSNSLYNQGESNGLYGTPNNVNYSTFFEWFIFQQSSAPPATPTGGTWDFATNIGVPPTGWSSSLGYVPLGTVWLSIAFLDSRNPTNIVWSAPGILTNSSVYATAYADVFTGDGSTVNWTMSANPVVINNLDVSVNGVTQTPNTDYTFTGTTFTTSTPAPIGAIILVKYKQSLPAGFSGAASQITNIPAGGITSTNVQSALNELDTKKATVTSVTTNTTNIATNTAAIATLNGATGSANVGYTPAGTGAVVTTVQTKLRQNVSVKDFGAMGDGVTDDTAAFNLAQSYAAGVGGALIRVPTGTYVLKDFDITNKNIIFEGETSGYGYTNVTTNVSFIPAIGATYVARLKGSTANQAAQSGFKNIEFNCPTSGLVKYGLMIDCGNTILEQVTIQGFQYGCVLPAAANSNRFTNCAFVLNTKVGFAATEAVFSATLYSGVSGISTLVENTAFTMSGCIFRQNGFGMVLRAAENCLFSGCVFESNVQAGIYIYRPDNANVFGINFQSCWFENNYDGYISGSTSYSITGNDMFLITNSSTYIAWTSIYQAGYQLLIDSQTQVGGGSWSHDFTMCTFGCDNAAQKDIFVIAAFTTNFRKCEFIGSGDTANLIKCANTAIATHFYDPVAGNNPSALVTSLSNSFGANTGAKGAYFVSGTTSPQLGGLYPQVGVFGGPIQFTAPIVGDPRNADVRTLDDYFEGDNSYTIPWRVGAATPFTVNTQTTNVTKIGRQVHVEMVATLTANATTATTDKLYSGQNLPYTAAALGNIVGQAWVQATGGGATVSNNGICPMWMDSTTSLYGAIDVFPILAIGMTYTIKVSATYTAAT